jgi:hypothetical protein
MGNQNPYSEGQTTQWPKEKGQMRITSFYFEQWTFHLVKDKLYQNINCVFFKTSSVV